VLGRIYIELIKAQFLKAGGTPDQFRAALAARQAAHSCVKEMLGSCTIDWASAEPLALALEKWWQAVPPRA
jgi:hypothetical protein